MLIDDNGNTTGILSSGEDITERRRAEASLRASESRFRQMAENLQEVFWITNADKTELEYVSPHLNRFGVEVWRTFMRGQKELDLETELRRAFSNSEFELYYQPQVDLKTVKLVGAEALLRWRHPKRGLLPPAAFLRVLKESPIAAAVGNWTIAKALAEHCASHCTLNCGQSSRTAFYYE